MSRVECTRLSDRESVILNIDENSTIVNLLYYLNSIGFISFVSEAQPFLRWNVIFNNNTIDYYSTIKEIGADDDFSLLISYNSDFDKKALTGKEKCNLLREIRRRVALVNNIDYEPAVCNNENECLGTCPKCEQEAKYIEEELIKRASLGYKISLCELSPSFLDEYIKSRSNGNNDSNQVEKENPTLNPIETEGTMVVINVDIVDDDNMGWI